MYHTNSSKRVICKSSELNTYAPLSSHPIRAVFSSLPGYWQQCFHDLFRTVQYVCPGHADDFEEMLWNHLVHVVLSPGSSKRQKYFGVLRQTEFNTYAQSTLFWLQSCFEIAHLVLCYPQFVATVSRTLVFFSKHFNTCVQRTLMRLKSCYEIA